LNGAQRLALEWLAAARLLDHRLDDVSRLRNYEAQLDPAFLALGERAGGILGILSEHGTRIVIGPEI
jgi:hypothetical protein